MGAGSIAEGSVKKKVNGLTYDLRNVIVTTGGR